MGQFQFEWWTVEVNAPAGRETWEVKAKNKDNAVKQIKKWAKEENEFFFPRCGKTVEVLWDTMTLDRKGYQRLY